MVTPTSPTPEEIPVLHSSDVATYLHVMESRTAASERDLATAERVAEALQIPEVREQWKIVLQLEDPVLHPERYNNPN